MYCIAAFLYSPLSIPIRVLYMVSLLCSIKLKYKLILKLKKKTSKNKVIEYITTKFKI